MSATTKCPSEPSHSRTSASWCQTRFRNGGSSSGRSSPASWSSSSSASSSGGLGSLSGKFRTTRTTTPTWWSRPISRKFGWTGAAENRKWRHWNFRQICATEASASWTSKKALSETKKIIFIFLIWPVTALWQRDCQPGQIFNLALSWHQYRFRAHPCLRRLEPETFKWQVQNVTTNDETFQLNPSEFRMVFLLQLSSFQSLWFFLECNVMLSYDEMSS